MNVLMGIHLLLRLHEKEYVLLRDFFKTLYSFPNGTTYVGHSSHLCTRDTASKPYPIPLYWFMLLFFLEKNPWLMLNAWYQVNDVWCCAEHLAIPGWTDNRKCWWKVLWNGSPSFASLPLHHSAFAKQRRASSHFPGESILESQLLWHQKNF